VVAVRWVERNGAVGCGTSGIGGQREEGHCWNTPVVVWRHIGAEEVRFVEAGHCEVVDGSQWEIV
jgi:hypothetical protein